MGSDFSELATTMQMTQLMGKVPVSTHEDITVETTGFGCHLTTEMRKNSPECYLPPWSEPPSMGFDTRTFFKHYEGVVKEADKIKGYTETDVSSCA